MPRNMSFALTEQQFRDKSKDVTRRLGWQFLKPGDQVMGCRKCMGLKPGEKITRLGLIEIIDVTRIPLTAINPRDVIREGFTSMSPTQFIKMFCEHMDTTPHTMVTRIEYKYL